MKVSIKSEHLDLEIDNVGKLQEVLDFVQKFRQLELEMEATRLNLMAEAGRVKKPNKTKKRDR